MLVEVEMFTTPADDVKLLDEGRGVAVYVTQSAIGFVRTEQYFPDATASAEQIATAIATCYPVGIPDDQFDTALRGIFRHLRRQVAA